MLLVAIYPLFAKRSCSAESRSSEALFKSYVPLALGRSGIHDLFTFKIMITIKILRNLSNSASLLIPNSSFLIPNWRASARLCVVSPKKVSTSGFASEVILQVEADPPEPNVVRLYVIGNRYGWIAGDRGMIAEVIIFRLVIEFGKVRPSEFEADTERFADLVIGPDNGLITEQTVGQFGPVTGDRAGNLLV